MLSNPRSWFVSAELLCVVTPMLNDFTAFTDFFCQILCKLGGRGRPSWRQQAEQMCRHSNVDVAQVPLKQISDYFFGSLMNVGAH